MYGHSLITIDKVKPPAKQLMSQLANLNPVTDSAFYRDKVTCGPGKGAQLESEHKIPTIL